MEEKYTFQEIIDMMEQAESYEDLYLAADLIVDPGVREVVLQDISQCESDNDEVEVAYSVVTSDILDTLAMLGDKNVLESTTDRYKDLPKEEIYELISNRMFQGMDIEKTIEETVSAIMNDYGEDYAEDLIREYVRLKASEVYANELDESKQEQHLIKSNTNKDRSCKLESMDWLNADKTYRYQLLDRLRQDCDYYLSNGNRYAKHLWAGNEQGQIEMMRKLWNSFSAEDKPEWLTMEQIDNYAERMGVRDKSLATNKIKESIEDIPNLAYEEDIDKIMSRVRTSNNVSKFSGIEFEKHIPYTMRFKEYDVKEGEDGKTLYWVTQEFFTKDELIQFHKAFVQELTGDNLYFKDAYVTVRDLSTYNLDKDYENGVLCYITKDTVDWAQYDLDEQKEIKTESDELNSGKQKLVEDGDNGTIHSDLGYFYIGDPCYVLSEEDYHDVWGSDNNFNDGTISVDEKYSFIVHGTAYGDGEYEDQYGHLYGVDSGTLAVIPMELVSKQDGIKYGATFKSNSATLDYYDDGVFTIGLDDKNVIIPTGDIEDDYEEDEEYMDEEYIEESKHTRNQNYKSNYTDGESIVIDSVKDGVVSWHYDFEEDGVDGPFESDIYDNTKFKDDEGYEWDLKKDFGYTITEGIKDNNYKYEDTLKEFVKLKQAILKEKQFNKKVDLNQQLNSFMDKNNISVKDNKQSWYGIKDDEVVYDIFSGDKLIGVIGVGKNNIEVLQKGSDKLTESSEDNTYYYELHFDFTEISGKDSDGYSIFFKSNELVDDDVEEIWNLAVRENKIDEYDDFEDVDYAQQIDKEEYESAIGTKTTKECKLLEMIDDNLDLSEQLLTIVGIKGSPEMIDSLLQKISNSSEPYITSDWVYDEVRIHNEPLTQDEIELFDGSDVYTEEDIKDKNIRYNLDEDTVYHCPITLQDRNFDLMFKIVDYYNCVIKIWDIVEE